MEQKQFLLNLERNSRKREQNLVVVNILFQLNLTLQHAYGPYQAGPSQVRVINEKLKTNRNT